MLSDTKRIELDKSSVSCNKKPLRSNLRGFLYLIKSIKN